MTNIEKSLRIIGKNEELRNKFISFIKEVEARLPYEGSVRDGVTKYLVDALFDKDDYLVKSIQNGLKYKFSPGIGSKIAREFILSTPDIPEFAWEPQTTKLLLYLSQNAKSVFVGGAYFGDQVIPIANLIKKNDGKVYAFDLNVRQIETLHENADMNNLPNIVSELKGLWNDSKTHLNLSDTDDLAFATPATGDKKSNTVTIDEYMEEKGIETADLIMLDVEGAEYNILQGAQKQLKKDKGSPNIVFEVHASYMDWSKGLDNTDLIQYLKSFGYHVFAVRDFQGNYNMKDKPVEIIPSEATYIKGGPHGFNMMAIKDLSLIKNDVFRMCENVSPKYIVHKDPMLHHPMDGFHK
jgi:FkbM family methyltransferase